MNNSIHKGYALEFVSLSWEWGSVIDDYWYQSYTNNVQKPVFNKVYMIVSIVDRMDWTVTIIYDDLVWYTEDCTKDLLISSA